MIAIATIVILAAIAAWAYLGRQRSAKLRERFGPEYDRTVQTAASPAEAEADLRQRAARVDRFKLRPLSRQQADSFAGEWRRVQALFVDDPHRAVGEADRLVDQVMSARGYPLDEFERRAEDVSVDHPHVVENYRTARALMIRRDRGEATTEELRQAVVNYRALFDDLLQVDERHSRRAS
jgi:hypothetical protein